MNVKKLTDALLIAGIALLPSCTNKAEQPSLPTSVSATLTNLHIISNNSIEGDVTLQNTGANDTWIATGVKQGGDLGNFYPTQFALFARGMDGKIHSIPTPVPPHGAKVGSETVLPMRSNAPQTIHVQWNLFAAALPPDSYQFYVQFDGAHEGFKCIPCWKGRINSNMVPLNIP